MILFGYTSLTMSFNVTLLSKKINLKISYSTHLDDSDMKHIPEVVLPSKNKNVSGNYAQT